MYVASSVLLKKIDGLFVHDKAEQGGLRIKKMDLGASSLTERFKQALDLCDSAYSKADQTPVVTEIRPRQVSFAETNPALVWRQQPQPPLPPQGPADHPWIQPLQSAPSFASTPPPRVSPSHPEVPLDNVQDVSSCRGRETLKTIAIVVGVLLLAAAAWFVRKRFVEPFFFKKKHPQKAMDLYGDDGEDFVPEQLPITPRFPTLGRRDRFNVSNNAEVRPGSASPQRASRKGKEDRGVTFSVNQREELDEKRRALLAAQRTVASRNAAKAAALKKKEEPEPDQDSGDEYTDEEVPMPKDPNFTEL